MVTSDYRELLRREAIEVVDIATHPEDRVEIVEEALRAGKHVLSQKPFVIDLDLGERLVDLAKDCGVRLAFASRLSPAQQRAGRYCLAA